MGTRSPSRNSPGPTASTSPSCGFSLAVSGITRPLAVRDSSSSWGFTTIRSPRGFKFIRFLLLWSSSRPLRVLSIPRFWHSRHGSARGEVTSSELRATRSAAFLDLGAQVAAFDDSDGAAVIHDDETTALPWRTIHHCIEGCTDVDHIAGSDLRHRRRCVRHDPTGLSLIHISEPTRRTPISYAVFCLKK